MNDPIPMTRKEQEAAIKLLREVAADINEVTRTYGFGVFGGADKLEYLAQRMERWQR